MVYETVDFTALAKNYLNHNQVTPWKVESIVSYPNDRDRNGSQDSGFSRADLTDAGQACLPENDSAEKGDDIDLACLENAACGGDEGCVGVLQAQLPPFQVIVAMMTACGEN